MYKRQLLDTGSLPVGAYIERTTIGTVDGVPDQTASVGRITHNGSPTEPFDYQVDFRAVGSDQGILDVQNGGTTQASIIFWYLDDWPWIDPFDTTALYVDGFYWGRDWHPFLLSPYPFNALGTAVPAADGLFARPLNPTLEVSAVTGIELRTADVPEIIFEELTVSPPPPAAPALSILGMVALSSALSGVVVLVLRARTRRQAA